MAKIRTTIYLEEDLIKELDKIAKKMGFNRTQLIRSIIHDYLLHQKIVHYNVYEDHITLWDGRMNRLIDVYIRNNHLICNFCVSEDCEHVRFAKKIPKVQNKFKEKGIIIRD